MKICTTSAHYSGESHQFGTVQFVLNSQTTFGNLLIYGDAVGCACVQVSGWIWLHEWHEGRLVLR
jgi:hypothetical protein